MAKGKKERRRGDLAFDEFVKRPPELTVLTDHPLTGEEVEETFADDPFNFRYKLGPVFDILRHPGTKTPAAILISGGWGTGKTSAMKWLEYLVEKWNKTDPKGGTKVRPVWFYPWKYDSKEDVRRGLIAEVIINSIDVKTATTQTVINAAKQFGLFLGKSFLHVLASIKLKAQVSADGGPVKPQAGTEVDLASIKEILAEYQQAAHPEKAFLNEFERTLEGWVKSTLGQDERMVIFIDDLDRCMPEIALQVLEALKLYLNVPNLVFVLGVDKEVIQNLVVEHYRELGLVKEKRREETEEEQRERMQAERKARQYLSKIFQVEIDLVPSERQIDKFFDDQLKNVRLWTERLRGNPRQALYKRLVLKFARRNPREVKRQLNNALLAGAGTELIRVERQAERPTFEQGLQLYFVAEILKGYTLIADMVNTDSGRRFLKEWSDFVKDNAQDGELKSFMDKHFSQ